MCLSVTGHYFIFHKLFTMTNTKSAQVISPAELLHQAVRNNLITWFEYSEAEHYLHDLMTAFIEHEWLPEDVEYRSKMMFFYRQMLYLFRYCYIYCPSVELEPQAIKAVFDLHDENDDEPCYAG